MNLFWNKYDYIDTVIEYNYNMYNEYVMKFVNNSYYRYKFIQ